jgi:hypothetical protein
MIRRTAAFLGFSLAQRVTILRSGKVDVSRLTCRAIVDPKAVTLCGRRAAWLGTAACPHEHIVPSLACDGHADIVRERTLTCYECARGQEPHSCPVTVEFLPLAAAAGARR